MVAIYHFSGGFLPNLHLASHSGIVTKSFLWVDLFFLLSGFILMHVYGKSLGQGFRKQAFKSFLLARIGRIYPLHVFMLAAFLALELIKLGLWHAGALHLSHSPFSAEATRSLPSLGANLLMLQSTGILRQLTWNGPAWSVGAEWYAYLAFPVLTLIVLRLNWLARGVIAALSIAGLALLAGGGSLNVTYDYGLIRCLLEFIGGMLVYLAYERRREAGWLGSDAVVLLIVTFVLVAMHLRWPDPIFPALFAVMILAMARNEGAVARCLRWQPLQFLGVISYSIYMLHIFVLETVNLIWRVWIGRGFDASLDMPQSLLALFLLLALVIALSNALHRHVEVPARAFFRQRAVSRLSERDV